MECFDTIMDYMQVMDYKVLSLMAVPIMAVLIFAVALLGVARKNDTVQRSSSRVCQLIRNPKLLQQERQNQQQHHHYNNGHQHQHHQQQQHHHHQQQQQQQQQHHHHNLNSKNDSSDSTVTARSQQQPHHHHHHHHNHNHNHNQPQQQHQQHSKQRKSRSHSKRQDNGLNAANASVGTVPGQKRTTDFSVDDWLSRDMVYCYDSRFMSSCVEDNMMPRHNPEHRNSTSSDAAASDDLNSSSSNEDLSAAYSVMSKTNKKQAGKTRPKRQRQRKQHELQGRNPSNLIPIPMDVDEDAKENQRPLGNAANNKNANINLRKQCTKAAALKAANKNNVASGKADNANANANALTTSPSSSSVCSTLSSASSTLSLSSSNSSSASNSPTNSANCSPTASPTASKRTAENFRKIARALAPPLRQHQKLNMSELELLQQLRRYIIDPNLLRVYGYPVESAIHDGCIEIYKCLTRPTGGHAHHFTNKSNIVNTTDGLQLHHTTTATVDKQWTAADGSTPSGDSVDSGRGSGDSSPPSMDSDSSEAGEDEPATTTACYTPDGSYQIFSQYDQSLEKQCVRCMRTFHVTEAGEYLSQESCTFHWGKLHNLYTATAGYTSQFTCCHRTKDAEGCSRNPLHVWTGAVVGINGPYTDFVHTRPRFDAGRPSKVYALDCEMSFTGRGLEVTKVTVVGYDGQLVYERFVRPEAEIVDYNTRFSGITEKDLCLHSNKEVKTLQEVQRDLLQLIDADTVLIGHALDNDLRVLRIVHKTVIDTSIAFPHSSGFPYRRALKNLVKACLNRDIQCGDAGHSSFEDSRACLELMLWKVRKEMRYEL